MIIPLDIVTPTFPFFELLKGFIDSKYKNEKEALKNEAIVITHRIVRNVFKQNENDFYKFFDPVKTVIKEEVPGGDFILYYGDILQDTYDD